MKHPVGLVRRFLSPLPWLLLLAAAADWAGLKSGRLGHPPAVLAVLAGAAALAFLLRLAVVLRHLRSGRRRPGAALGEALVAAGIAATLGGGMANWLLGLQGFVILQEGQGLPLAGGSHLQHFEGGPLARIEEMEVMLALRELELEPVGDGFFYPLSRLEVQRGHGEPVLLSIHPRRGAAAGPLRFHQGAFGFAPRIVILKRGETVFDRVVPFTSERRGSTGITFAGHFTVAREALEVRGSVDLDSLDEGLRGHATLSLSVVQNGSLLGRGSLLPGHFADLADGWRVGFADLAKWSEIDIMRRNYGAVMLAGAGLALAGALWWLLAWWRGW